MSSTREIITLQVGHYANFIGSHWWNIQEASFNYDKNNETDINHDFMFREGMTSTRLATYTPRLLAIDAKGSLNNLASSGSLYDSTRTPSPLEASWEGKVHVVHQLHGEKNDFLKDLEKDDARYLKSIDEDRDICIDDTNDSSMSETNKSPLKIYNLKNKVRVWSDYLHTHLHPQSIYLFNDIWHREAEMCGIEAYWGHLSGTSIMKKEINQDEISDRIRLMAESCGSLQGFHLLTDAHNGMGGVSCGVAQHLADEFGSKDTITFAVTPPHFSAANIDISAHCLTSIIQCYTELSNLTNLVVPLNLKQHAWSTWSPVPEMPYLKFNPHIPYESSVIFSSFLDTISMAYRSKHSPLPMSHLVQLLTIGGRKVTIGNLSLPIGLPNSTDLLSWLRNGGKINNISLSGGYDGTKSPIAECQIIRGLDEKILNRNRNDIPPNIRMCNTAQLYEQHLVDTSLNNSIRHIASVKDPIKTGKTYPHIFDESINQDGFIDPSNISPSVSSLPSIAGLYQGREVHDFLSKLMTSGMELNVSKIPTLLEEGIDGESWTEQLEVLGSLIGCYQFRSTVIDDSDDD